MNLENEVSSEDVKRVTLMDNGDEALNEDPPMEPMAEEIPKLCNFLELIHENPL